LFPELETGKGKINDDAAQNLQRSVVVE